MAAFAAGIKNQFCFGNVKTQNFVLPEHPMISQAFVGRFATVLAYFGLISLSTFLALDLNPGQLSWDEADYTSGTILSWKELRDSGGYERHHHGPMLVVLAKLGKGIPESWGSIESRMRFPGALMSGLGVGLIFWGLTNVFGTSRLAAFLGANLLAFSMIRIQETSIVGPHYPMVLWTASIAILGFRWHTSTYWWSAAGLGVVFGFTALTMSYWIPLLAAWGASSCVARGTWVRFDRWSSIKISRWILAIPVFAIAFAVVAWPHKAIVTDFFTYAKLARFGFPTVVGDTLHQHAPRSAFYFWLKNRDLPIFIGLVFAVAVFVRSLFTHRQIPTKNSYLATFGLILLLAACSAHIAGARNLLLFLVIASMWIALSLDQLKEDWPRVTRWLIVSLVFLSTINMFWLRSDPAYIPYLHWNGYREFVKDNKEILARPNTAVVEGVPILKFYAHEENALIGWNIFLMPWSTDASAAIPESAEWALLGEAAWRFLPRDSVIQSVIVRNWTQVWSFKQPGTWELRLYQKPK